MPTLRADVHLAALRKLDHRQWTEHIANINAGRDFQGLSLERRVFFVLRMEALGVYDAVCTLEKLVEASLQGQVVYSWPWRWRLGGASKDGEGELEADWA